jgi:outer membrane protein TolC
LVQHVLARNPTVVQMVAAWEAAQARYPQATSLDDPLFGTALGPASIASNDVDFAYRLELSQKYPFPGKLGLRGRQARAEAGAAGREVADISLQLVESAKTAFYDYYLVHRATAVNEEALALLRQFRENALARFKNNLVPEQDVRQAEVEIGRQRERGLLLERLRQVAVARLNTLMHLPPDRPLPPPPAEVRLGEALPEAPALRAAARARRPDLQALAARLAAEEAALALAHKEFYPDVEVLAAYDAFWQRPEEDLRPQLAARVNLPLRTARRHAAVAEAEARVRQRRAEIDRLADQINYEVQQAYAQVRESERVVRLYDETVLPAADQNVKAATVAYAAAKIPFLSLIEAQRNRVDLRDRYYEALADSWRRRATLERVVGGSQAVNHGPNATGTATP